jgi:hypothetical protein
MAILKYYNPTVHDIHTYNPQAFYYGRVDGQQQGFNASCQAAAIDWSGVSLRPRSFARELPNNVKSTLTIPYVVSNINFWHTLNPAAVLISPKHALICQHYRGSGPVGPSETYTFLGRSGTRYTRRAIQATPNIGIDHVLLEFETAFPANDVRVYDQIADVRYIPQGRPIWVHDCQGRAYKLIFDTAFTFNGVTERYTFKPSVDGINEGPSSSNRPVIWEGDSGSPTFVLDSAGNTILIGLKDAFDEQINAAEIAAINAKLLPSGYSVTHVQYVYGGTEQIYGGFQSTSYPFVEVIEPISYERGKALKSSFVDFRLNVYSDVATAVPIVKMVNISGAESTVTCCLHVLDSNTNTVIAAGCLDFGDNTYAYQEFVRYHFDTSDFTVFVPGYVLEGYICFNKLINLIQAFADAQYGAVLTLEPTTVALFSNHRVNNIYCRTAKPLIAQTAASKYISDSNPVSGAVKLVAGNNCNISVQSATKTVLISAQRNANDSTVERCGVWSEKVSTKDILCNEVIYSISGVTPDDNGNVTFDAVAPLVCSSLTATEITATRPEFTGALSSFGSIIRFIYVGLPQAQGNSSVFNCDTGTS